MDIVLGVSMAPTTVRLVVIEGQDADGVTVEQDEFEIAAAATRRLPVRSSRCLPRSAAPAKARSRAATG